MVLLRNSNEEGGGSNVAPVRAVFKSVPAALDDVTSGQTIFVRGDDGMVEVVVLSTTTTANGAHRVYFHLNGKKTFWALGNIRIE